MDFDIKEFLNECRTSCSKAQFKTFKKNEVITTYIENRNQICILNSGEADLIRYDLKGNKTIIKHLSKYDIFGETFYPVKINNELFVTAKKNSEVVFFNYDNINQKCKSNCKFHSYLSQHINNLILNQIINLNSRIEILTQKTIRDKLLSYFNMLSRTRTY